VAHQPELSLCQFVIFYVARIRRKKNELRDALFISFGMAALLFSLAMFVSAHQ
jgi:hypothetical protein